MEVVRRKSDNVIVLIGKELTIDEIGVSGIGLKKHRAYTNVDYEIINIIEKLPYEFIQHGYAYDSGIFTPTQIGLDFQAEQQAKKDIEDLEHLKHQASSELERNDKVFIRHGKRGVGFNQEWRNYDDALRDIATGISSTMPNKPSTYPDGSDVIDSI